MNKQSALVLEYLENLESDKKHIVERFANEIEAGVTVYENNGIPELTLAALLAETRKQIRDEAAKANGTLKPKKGAEKILKSAAKNSPSRPSLQYAHTKDGIQYVCDGYRIVAYHVPLELPELPSNLKHDVLDFARSIERLTKHEYEPLPLTYAEVKEKYMIHKAKKTKQDVYWQTEAGIGYNAAWILEMFEALPDSTVSLAKGLTGAMKFESDGLGVGYLLPKRCTTNVTNVMINKDN